MDKSIVLGLMQLNLSGGVQQNLDKTERLLGQAQVAGASLVLLPELFPYPWFPVTEDSRHWKWAEPESGPIVGRVRAWAKQYHVTMVLPTYQLDQGRRFNTSYVISDQGDLLGWYRKTHIPYHPGWYEKYYYEPGDSGWPVFYHRGITFGIQTCWDNLFPEGSRILGLRGVHLILAPRGTGDYSRPRWRTALAANALANNCFVASVNRVGQEGDYPFGGDSYVIAPDGEMWATQSQDDELLVVPLDIDRVYASRREWPFRDDRRPGLYGPLVSGEGEF